MIFQLSSRFSTLKEERNIIKMHLTAQFFQNAIALTFISLCSSYNEEWLDFPELSELSKGCKPKNCSDADTESQLSNGVCDCDERCLEFGTCCINSPFTTLSSTELLRRPEQCCEVEAPNFGAFMVSNCNPRWRGPHVIRELCQKVKPSNRDPLATIPVTNPQYNITYKNFFCSLCNFNDQSETVLWNIRLEIEQEMPFNMNATDRENIIRRMEYSRNAWGIRNAEYNNSMEFVPINIKPRIPSSLRYAVKTCVPRLVSTCATTWKNVMIKKMCHAYLSPISLIPEKLGTLVRFRNPHCAMCNHMTNLNCLFFSIFSPSLSFTLLLDVNPSDGSKVGEANSCEPNEIFDPFFQKCRALVCAVPGYVVKNGQCVRN